MTSHYFVSIVKRSTVRLSSDITLKEESTILATVVLEWKKLTPSFGKAKNYIVLYKLSQPSKYWNVAKVDDTQVYLKNIQPNTEYTVRVLVLTISDITYESESFALKTGTGMLVHGFFFRFRKHRYEICLYYNNSRKVTLNCQFVSKEGF